MKKLLLFVATLALALGGCNKEYLNPSSVSLPQAISLTLDGYKDVKEILTSPAEVNVKLERKSSPRPAAHRGGPEGLD